MRTILLKNGISINDEQLALLDRYVGLLIGWNRKVNLISRKDEANVWQSHILHSLSLLFVVRLPSESTVLDLGTGGGLPGIPLKILLPGMNMTLMDSIQKKMAAVRDILDRLPLAGVTTVSGRAEEIGKRFEYRGQFDLVLARGVASLPELIKNARPFLNVARDHKRGSDVPEGDGRGAATLPALIAFKGGPMEDELAKAKRQGSMKAIRTIDLVFRGSEEASLTDKKIVIVEF